MIGDVLQAARQLGDRVNEAWALHQLGTHAIGMEQPSQAIDFLRQAFDLRNALGDVVGAAYTQHNLDLLILPPSQGGHNSPVKPKGSPSTPGRLLNFLWKTIIIGTVIVIGGYVLIAKAHNQPFVPVTGGAMPMVVNTRIVMATLTAVATPTVTLTNTVMPTDEPTNTPLISIIVTTPSPARSLTLTGLQNANCRIGPSTAYDPPYGTLLKGQTVDILGVNAEGTWFLVKHPQSFRYPCWVWNGPAVQLNGDFSGLRVVAAPPAIKLRAAASQAPSSPSTSPEPPGQVNLCLLYPALCSDIAQLFIPTSIPTATPPKLAPPPK